MKHRYHLLLAGLAVLAVAAVAFFAMDAAERHAGSDATSKIQSVATVPRADVKAAIGSRDDPMARFNFERMRTVDPKTGEIPTDVRRRELAYARTLPTSAAKTAALSWVRRGPFNIGGRTRAFGMDSRDTDILLAGGVTGSIWKSTDAGATWTDTFVDSDLHSVTSIAQDRRAGAEDTWYAGTGEILAASGSSPGATFYGNGLYKSTDNGSSWAALPATTTSISNAFATWWQIVWEVATDPSAGSAEVYAANAGGIDRSTNGGTSFTSVLFGSFVSTACRTDVATTSTGAVYASLSTSCGMPGGDTGIYSSATGDFGDWLDLDYPFGPTFRRAEISVSPADEDMVWVLSQLDAGTHKLHLYDSTAVACPGIGGAPTSGWCDYSAFLPARATAAGTGVFDTQSSYDMFVKAHPTMTNIVLVGGTSLFRIDILGTPGTDESGDTWIGGYIATGASAAVYKGDLVASDEHHPDQHSGLFLPPPYGMGAGQNDPDIFFSGSDGGLHRTPDVMEAGDGAVDWFSLNNGYHTTQFHAACLHNNDTEDWVGGGLQDNGSHGTTSAGATVPWVEELSGDGGNCAGVDNTGLGTSRYVSAQNGIIYRNVYNASGTFTGFTRVDPTGASGYLFINPFAIDPSDETIMYHAAGDSIWRNSDLEGIALFSNATTSTNWTNLEVPGVSGSVSAFGVSSTGSRLYFGTSTGSMYRIDGADTYTPAGAIMTISTGLPSAYVSSISVDPSDADRVMITYSNYNTVGVWFSDDGGSTWTDVEGNLFGTVNGAGDDGPSFRSAALFSDAAPTSYFVGTSTGLYSTDLLAGSSTVWTLEGPTEMGNTIAEMVKVRASDGFIVVGTHGHGLFTADASLPVELADLNAVVDQGDLVLNWSTHSELNNTGFEVEYRLIDTGDFQSAGFVSGAGTSATPSDYSYRIENVIPGEYELRLKQVDASGASTYSRVVEASIQLTERFVITDAYPNPASDVVRFSISSRDETEVSVAVYDVTGRRVLILHDGRISGNSPKMFEVDARALAAGSYFVRLDATGYTSSKPFIVVR